MDAPARKARGRGTLAITAVALFGGSLGAAAQSIEPAKIVFPDSDDESICSAGASGDACRARSLEATADLEWRVFPGCAIPAGGDLGEPELLTVDAAKHRCGSLPRCVGFTFEGNDPDGPLSGGPVWTHMKDKFDCLEAEWVAYRKAEGRGAAAPASPPPPPEELDLALTVSDPNATGQGVALCLSGQVRMLQTTAPAMQQNLLAVLEPDVFMYGPASPGGEEPELLELAEYLVMARWENEDIRTRLYSETRNPGRTIDLEYVEVQGNWFGNQCLSPPLRDNRPGSALCLYYNQQRCLDMIRDHEEERGTPYEWVVVSRTDFRWLAPHPPLELLGTRDAVWIPSGSDWEGGINDRHAVMRRKYVDQYLSGWTLITRGRAKDVMLDTLGSMKVMGYPGPNTENFLRARLAHYEVPIERFPNVAFLTCTQRTKSRWTQCSGTSSNDAPGWLYKEEMEHATRIAKCVRSSWTKRKMEDCAEDISHLYRGIR